MLKPCAGHLLVHNTFFQVTQRLHELPHQRKILTGTVFYLVSKLSRALEAALFCHTLPSTKGLWSLSDTTHLSEYADTFSNIIVASAHRGETTLGAVFIYYATFPSRTPSTTESCS